MIVAETRPGLDRISIALYTHASAKNRRVQVTRRPQPHGLPDSIEILCGDIHMFMDADHAHLLAHKILETAA